jgi:hypothetical protein
MVRQSKKEKVQIKFLGCGVLVFAILILLLSLHWSSLDVEIDSKRHLNESTVKKLDRDVFLEKLKSLLVKEGKTFPGSPRVEYLRKRVSETWSDEFDFVDNPNLKKSPHLSTRKDYQSFQERVDNILNSQDIVTNVIPKGVQTFESFCEKIPEWCNSSKSFVFFRDDIRVKDKDVLVQRSHEGDCYINAPIVLQHYLVSMNSNESAGMIDLSIFIRDSYEASEETVKDLIL